MKSVLVCAFAILLQAQQPQDSAVSSASISGVVRDAGTGAPLAHYVVTTDINGRWVDNALTTTPASKEVRSNTDDTGRYKLSGLPAGHYRLTALNPERGFFQRVEKTITLSGHDIDAINFDMVTEGRISGKIVDQNGEPLPGMTVHAISREYFQGAIGYFFDRSGTTNDRGEYTIERIEPGHPYLILAEHREYDLPAHSEVPLNPKLRRRIGERTWYPGVDRKESAAPIQIRTGEHREGIDVEVKQSQSYCAQGEFENPSSRSEIRFEIEPLQPSSGVRANGGSFFRAPGGVTGSDGKFRICDLYRGTFRLTGVDQPNERSVPAAFVATTLNIVDRDLEGIHVPALPALPLSGEVVWDADPPSTPVVARVSVSLQPLLRTQFREESLFARPEVPGSFSFPSLLMDDYKVRCFLFAPGLYIKDVTYAGHSVMHDRLSLGSTAGESTIRVVIAHNGVTFSAQVSDHDGNPVQNLHVITLPALATSEAELADLLIKGDTDQLGQYTSRTLAPGKYYVAASDQTFDETPESISKLWRSRNQFKEVTLPPNGSAQLRLEPIRID